MRPSARSIRLPAAWLAPVLLLAAPLAAQSPHGETMTRGVVEGRDFLVWEGDGDRSSFAEILAALDGADAVLVGESHDDEVGHGVEAQLLARAAERFGALDGRAERPVILSLEMFERDVQGVLDEYLGGLITEDHFLDDARPWDNYRSDYRPMVELARAHGLPVVAANAPRRYVNRVSRLGPESLGDLPDRARRHLPELPYPGPSDAYRAQWEALMAGMMEEDQEEAAPEETGALEETGDVEAPADAPSPHAAPEPTHAEPESPNAAPENPHAPPENPHAAPENPHAAAPSPDAPPENPHAAPPPGDLPEGHPPLDEPAPPPTHDLDHALQAQALWDAAMGEAVADALARHPGGLVLHFAGSFHVARGTGVPERVGDYRPGARIVTVVLRPAEDIRAWDEEEHRGLADFVVLTRDSDPS